MNHSSARWGAALVGVPLAVAVAATFSWAIETQSYNVWGAVVVVPVVAAVNAALIWRVSRVAEPWLGKVLALALLAKFVGVVVRYLVAYGVYDGVADAERYNLYAVGHYELWRQGVIQWDWVGARGTQYMELITTGIYTLTGPSPLAGFLIFGSFAFWGQYLLYRAFRIAVPHGDHRRYALLVLFLPSMLYWPASIGKESWLMLFVGVTAFGAAKWFTRESGAFALLGLGALGTGVIRPHIALLLFAGIAVAQLFRPTGDKSTDALSRLGGLAVLGVVAIILASQSATFLGIDDLDWQGVAESVEFRQGQTSQGGSVFTPVPVTSIFGLPAAVVTVIFRPFPWEAHNAQLLAQSLEGLFLLMLTVMAWPRLRRLPRVMRQNPYVVFAAVYSLAFVVAFSGFGNFGILARQRVLMLPFFLVLLSLPSVLPTATRQRAAKEFEHARR